MRTAASILALAALIGLAGAAAAQGNAAVTAKPGQGLGWELYPPLESQTPEGRCKFNAELAATYAISQLQDFDAKVTIEISDGETSCKLTMADAARTVDFEGQPD